MKASAESELRPFDLFQADDDPPLFSLMLTDEHMAKASEAFDGAGRYSNGYGWADVALGVMRTLAPDLERKVSMDPEAGTFVASSEDREALVRLGQLLSDAYHDRAKLTQLVAAAPFEWD